MKKSLKILTVALLAVGVIGAMLTGCGQKEIENKAPEVKLNHYMIIKVEGVNGSGSITKMELNYEKLAQEHGDGREDAEELFRENCPTMKIDKADEEEVKQKLEALSNMDVIAILWDADEDCVKLLEETFDIDIVYTDFGFAVSGLEEKAEVE